MLYDTIIIGSGPAGLASAIYASRAKLNMLVVEQNFVSGGQVVDTYEVDNYPGLPGISGMDLGMKMREHAEKMGAEFVRTKVKALERSEQGTWRVICKKEAYESKTVILATGAHHKKLNVPGEDDLAGMGVSYCATCDGAFYKDCEVAVVGGGDVAVEDAIFLARTCKKVYLIHRRDQLRAAKVLQDRLFALPNVEIIWDSVVEKIDGTDQVEYVQIRNVRNAEVRSDSVQNDEVRSGSVQNDEVRSDSVQRVKVEGVFVAVGIEPESELVAGAASLDPNGYVIADETGRTDAPGLFVAGDVRTKSLRQIITAAADGANAVTSVEHYLLENQQV